MKWYVQLCVNHCSLKQKLWKILSMVLACMSLIALLKKNWRLFSPQNAFHLVILCIYRYIYENIWHYIIFVWSESHSLMSDSLRPHGLYSPWNSPGQNTGVGSQSLLQGIFPTQGSNPVSRVAGRFFLPSEPPGKPKNSWVVSLPLLQWVFLTQGSNRGLLHWRWILYQLSYQGSQ